MKKILAILTLALFIGGCYNDNMDEVYPGAGLFVPCDTTSVTSYITHVRPILDNNCVSCHTGSGANADVHLDTYDGVREVAINTRMYGATWHQQLYTPMPPNYQLDSCSLVQIKKWIDAGAPNN